MPQEIREAAFGGSRREGIRAGAAGEAPPGETPGTSKCMTILNFNTGGGGEHDLQSLTMQREMLKSQLMVLKSLSAIANQQASSGSRSARLENNAREMTLGMKSSAREMQKVAGDAAATLAKVNDVNRTTADMAGDIKEIARDIAGIEGAISNVESLIRETAARQESQQDEMQRQAKRQHRKTMRKLKTIENKVDNMNDAKSAAQ